MTAAAEAEAAEKEDGAEGVKEEAGGATFEACQSFQGARPGWCFKMGARGLGYYRDRVQDVKQEKKEKVQVVKDEDEEPPKMEKTEQSKVEKQEKSKIEKQEQKQEKLEKKEEKKEEKPKIL